MTAPIPPDARPAADPDLQAEAAEWWVRRQDGLSHDEEAELQRWLSADRAHEMALERVGRVWGRLDTLPADAVEALKAGQPAAPIARLSPPRAMPPAAPAERQPSRRRWLLAVGRFVPQAAMAATVAAVAGGGWMGWDWWQHQPVYTDSFTSSRGRQLELTLPDGSQLRLDTGTRADVAFYRHRREVRLPEGQAYFSVKPRSGDPFEVLAGPLRISVVGTRFFVRRTSSGLGAGRVSVAVEEGRVRVSRLQSSVAPADGGAGAEAVELTAGQAVHADLDGHLSAVTVSPGGAAMAWREGRLILDDTPLGQAIAEFERYADTGLVVTDPAVAAMRLNGSFDLQQFAAFRRALPQVLPVRLQPRADGRVEIVSAR